MDNLKEITNTAKVTYRYTVEAARPEVIQSVEATVSNPFTPKPKVAISIRAEFPFDPEKALIYYVITISNQSATTLLMQLREALPSCLEAEKIIVDGKVRNKSSMDQTEMVLGEMGPNQRIIVKILAKVKNLAGQEKIHNQVSVIATYYGHFQAIYTSNETTVLVQNQPDSYSQYGYIRACPLIRPIYQVDYVDTKLFDCDYSYFMRRIKNKVYCYVRIWGRLQVVMHYQSANDSVYSYQYVTRYSQVIRIDEMRMQHLSKDFLEFEVQPVRATPTATGCRILLRTAIQKRTLKVIE